MLGEGAQEAEAQARIGDQQTVLPPRKAADAGNKPEKNSDSDGMHTPVRQMTIVALPDPACLLDEESPQPEQRTDQQSPGHGLIEHQQAPLEPSHARPIRLQNIVRLGIDPRNGEVDVAMMRAMALSVERVRKPQPQRWKYHGEAQPRRHAAEGVNGFMLQRKMPGDEIGADGHD